MILIINYYKHIKNVKKNYNSNQVIITLFVKIFSSIVFLITS